MLRRRFRRGRDWLAAPVSPRNPSRPLTPEDAALLGRPVL